jgi:hypothetical protein
MPVGRPPGYAELITSCQNQLSLIPRPLLLVILRLPRINVLRNSTGAFIKINQLVEELLCCQFLLMMRMIIRSSLLVKSFLVLSPYIPINLALEAV